MTEFKTDALPGIAESLAAAASVASPVADAPVLKPAIKKPVPMATARAPKPAKTAAPAARSAKDSPMTDTTIDTTQTTAPAENVADKAKLMFTQANDRAKATMEKGARAFEDVNAFHKGNLEALVESSKIAARGFEKMGQDSATYLKTSYENATSQMKALSTVKSPTDFFKLQSDFARSAFDAFVAETSRSTEAALKLAGEIAQPISNRVALAADKMKVAA